jgi:hypothetical protein
LALVFPNRTYYGRLTLSLTDLQAAGLLTITNSAPAHALNMQPHSPWKTYGLVTFPICMTSSTSMSCLSMAAQTEACGSAHMRSLQTHAGRGRGEGIQLATVLHWLQFRKDTAIKVGNWRVMVTDCREALACHTRVTCCVGSPRMRRSDYPWIEAGFQRTTVASQSSWELDVYLPRPHDPVCYRFLGCASVICQGRHGMPNFKVFFESLSIKRSINLIYSEHDYDC